MLRTTRVRRGQLRNAVAVGLATGCLVAAGWLEHTLSASQQSRTPFPGGLPIKELTQEQAIRHALNRLGFGPSPGDIARVRETGLEVWIEQQLNPQSIDDAELEARLGSYSTLRMSSRQLMEAYPRPQLAARQAGISPGELNKIRQRVPQRQGNRRQNASELEPDEMSPNMQGEMADEARPAPNAAPLNPEVLERLRSLRRPQQIVQELAAAKMTRAIYSERQLQEVLADFWFNHFNVFAGKNVDRWLLTSYERDTIRPHVLGKFEDLLAATAKSPAMLVYLDNFQSADPAAFERAQQQKQIGQRQMRQRFGMLGTRRGALPERVTPKQLQQRQKRGLNENYARELMELHTLGVDGGYTQDDVIQVARVFTGWTVRQPRRTPEFFFNVRLHDPNPKVVLGKTISPNGIKEGEGVLDLLAHYASTTRFISRKLAERFVSDDPPQALVDRMADTFLKKDGDISAVLRTMIYSPEFWSREAYRAKIKAPFELIASTVRALGLETDQMQSLVQWTGRIGEPLYQAQPPTGYSDKAEAWVNTGALLNRMNFAMAIVGNARQFRRAGFNVLADGLRGSTADEALSKFIEAFLGGEIDPQTLETLKAKLAEQQRAADPNRGPQAMLPQIAGLVLGSPEFQRQ